MWEPKGATVAFLEFGLIEGQSFPSLNPRSTGSDPYVLLWPTSRPKETHKSKVHKKTVDPLFNETFGFMWELNTLANNLIQDSITVEVHNYKTVGNQVIGTPFTVRLSELPEGEEKNYWVDIAGSPGRLHITLMWYKLPSAEVPKPLLSHTGGSVTSKHFNSLTRTAVKDAIRKGKRGAVTDVEWLQVQVLQASGLVESKGDAASSVTPFFVAYLNSSQSVTFKSPVQKGIAPVFQPPAETGFELVCIVGGSIRDALQVDFYNFKRAAANSKLGSVSIPLDRLVVGEASTGWYALDRGDARVQLTLTRTSKAVTDLPVTGLNLGKRISAFMFYALSALRLKLLEYGLTVSLGISCSLGVIETRIGVTITPTAADMERYLKEQQAAEESLVEEVENDAESPVQEKAETLSAFKRFISKMSENMMLKFKTVLCDMHQHGLMGTCGISFKAGFPPYGLELALSIDLSMETVPLGVIQNFQKNYNTMLRSGHVPPPGEDTA